MTRRHFRLATAAGLCAAIAAAPTAWAAEDADGEPGRSEDRGHPVLMETSEQDCWELNTGRTARPADVDPLLPAGWDPLLTPSGRAAVSFVEYTCQSTSVDGTPGRLTTTAWLVAGAFHVQSGERRTWTLAHGTDNPLVSQRFRKLGIPSEHLQHTTATLTTTPDGSVAFEQRWEDTSGELSHERAGTAPDPGPLSRRVTSRFWFATEDGGAVSLTLTNHLTARVTATLRETFPAGSLYERLGITQIPVPTRNAGLVYLEGSWTGVLQREGS